MRWLLRVAGTVVISAACVQAMYVEHYAICAFPLPIATAMIAATATMTTSLLLLVARFHQLGIVVFLPFVAMTSILLGMPAALLLPSMLAIRSLWIAGDEVSRKQRDR